MDQEEQQRYERARARVKALKGFYTHATIYVIVNIFLFLIDLLTGGGWWFYWPLLGWGIGLGVHALNVFGFSGRLGRAEDQGVNGQRAVTWSLLSSRFGLQPRPEGR